jgi:hypothetical protein
VLGGRGPTTANVLAKKIPTSLVRVAAVVGALLLIVGLGVGMLIRQPSWGSLPYPDAGRASPTTLRQHVAFLAEEVAPRSVAHPENLERAAEYIRACLVESGGDVREQPYTAGGRPMRNVIARYGPEDGALVVVGAHYDGFGPLPAADDNASGVAGLLELARLLHAHPPPVPVELVAYSTEEPPFFGSAEMGSAVHARSLAESETEVRAMICLEMIGYFTDEQPAPNWILALLYPNQGDFVTVVGRWTDRPLVRYVKKRMRVDGDVRVCSYTGPTVIGADLSDHRNYWQLGYDAVMITDTAFIRNPHYHRATDTPETLDYERMASVVDGVFNTLAHFDPQD